MLGSFKTGGNPLGRSLSRTQNYELQNYTDLCEPGSQLQIRGAPARCHDGRHVADNFNGTFTFGGGVAPELDADNQPVLDSSGQPVTINIDVDPAVSADAAVPEPGLYGGSDSSARRRRFAIQPEHGYAVAVRQRGGPGSFCGRRLESGVEPDAEPGAALRDSDQHSRLPRFRSARGGGVGSWSQEVELASIHGDSRRVRDFLRPFRAGELL